MHMGLWTPEQLVNSLSMTWCRSCWAQMSSSTWDVEVAGYLAISYLVSVVLGVVFGAERHGHVDSGAAGCGAISDALSIVLGADEHGQVDVGAAARITI